MRDSDKIVNLKTPIITSQAQWVHHDHIGYIMLQPQPVHISITGQKGSFGDLSKLATQKSQVQRDVFNLWIDHGRDPIDASYAYGVIADIDQQKTDQLGSESKLGIKIIANRKDLQILKKGESFFVVATSAQNVVLEKNLIIDFDQPTLLLIEQKGSALSLVLSDPLQDKSKLTLRVMGKFKGPCTKILDGRTQIDLELDTSPGNRGRPSILELTPL